MCCTPRVHREDIRVLHSWPITVSIRSGLSQAKGERAHGVVVGVHACQLVQCPRSVALDGACEVLHVKIDDIYSD